MNDISDAALDAPTLTDEVPFFRVHMDDDLVEDCVRRNDHIDLVSVKDATITALRAEVERLTAERDAALAKYPEGWPAAKDYWKARAEKAEAKCTTIRAEGRAEGVNAAADRIARGGSHTINDRVRAIPALIDQPATTAEPMAAGEQMIDAHDIEEAENLLDLVLEYDPELDQAIIRLGDALAVALNRGDFNPQPILGHIESSFNELHTAKHLGRPN